MPRLGVGRPTIQGWTVEDYERHAQEMRPLIMEMRAFYEADGRAFRVGVGTLCNRVSVPDIHRIVGCVGDVLPGVGLHLWGIKLGAMQHRMGLPPGVASVDSAAWHGQFHRSQFDWKKTGMRKIEHAWRIGYVSYIEKVRKATVLREAHQIQLF